MTGLACLVKTRPIKKIPTSQTDKWLVICSWNEFTNIWLNKWSFFFNIHSLRKVLCGHTCFPRGVCSYVNFASLDRFTQPKNNSGSFIFVLCQLFWGEQGATVLPIHNRTKHEATLLSVERVADKDSIAKLAVHLNNQFLCTLFHLLCMFGRYHQREHLHFPFFSPILGEGI